MISKSVFLEKDLPYEKLEKIGIDRKCILSMPKEIIDPLLNGQITPLIRADIKTTYGRMLHIPLKLQITRDLDGKVKVLTYPVRREIQNDMKLSTPEMERLKRGEVIKKDVVENGVRRQKYIQLDKETNSLMKRNISGVKMQERLREIEKINNIELGLSQKQAIIEGKPVELNVGDHKVSVGVDLKEPQGFKVVQGDMTEWDRQQKIKYDLAHEGFVGYVQTDKNRWEYQQVLDKLSGKEEVHVAQKKELKQEQKQSSGIRR